MNMNPPPNHVSGMLLDFSPPSEFEPTRDPHLYDCINSEGKNNKIEKII